MGKTKFSASQKKVILTRQDWKCARCGKLLSPKSSIPPQFDHVEAEGLGGPTVTGNGQALCPDCHAQKTAEDQARMVDKRRLEDKSKIKVDEHTPIIRVYKASEDPRLSQMVYSPQRFYWNVTVENVGRGVALNVDFSVTETGGRLIGKLRIDHLYAGERKFVPTPYDPLKKTSWVARASYTDAKGRGYPAIELTIEP